MEQTVLAEQVGFDRVWTVKHHSLLRYAHMSASEIFPTWVAARTSRIPIGHGVVTLPFGYQHPLRVAERSAMLDALPGGRLDRLGATAQEMSTGPKGARGPVGHAATPRERENPPWADGPVH